MLFRSLTRHKPACKYGNVSANPCIKGGCVGCSVQQRECQRTGIATPRICSSRALEANLSVLILLAYQSYLQAAQNEVEDTRGQTRVAERELQREREASELRNQQSTELQECHCKLLEEYKSAEEIQEDLIQSVNDSKAFADEVARRAESLVKELQAKLAGSGVSELQNGQSIREMILESAKNALLIEAFSSQHPEEDPLTALNFIADQNVGLQQRISELSEQAETLSRQVKAGKNDVTNLTMALELAAEDGQRKKPLRGKVSGEKK
jgi:hypothetical protein